MLPKVAIVAVAQSAGSESKDNLYDQAYWVTKEALQKANLTRAELGTLVSAASDIFHGSISCASSYFWESVGGFLKNGTRQDGESLLALFYAAMRIMSGHYDTALAVGVCKGSENPENDALTSCFASPFIDRALGLNETVIAALQMKQYMAQYKISLEQCAMVATKNLKNALGNPYAHRKGKYSVEDVLKTDLIVDPLTELQCAPRSEGFIAVVLASEEKAKRLTDKPVWLSGFGSSIDNSNVGDRNLLESELRTAATRAYEMAGIRDPREDIDVVETSESYAYQELLWCEELGLCQSGEGGRLIESGVTQIDGELPVNPSGGVLANNPYVSRGLQRAVECVLQLRGEAGEHQLPGDVRKALAHGSHGFGGQCHAVAILEK